MKFQKSLLIAKSMPRVAIYTLCRDRLEYTKHCFARLRERAGVEFDHYVVDNGSQDGTVEWLKENKELFKMVVFNKENLGISKASNQALECIFSVANQEKHLNYDFVVKMDNDCEVESMNILGQILEVFDAMGIYSSKYILSPYVEGINKQPARGRFESFSGRRIGLTAIVGGLFHVVPASVYRTYRFPENLPKAKGQDDVLCDWFKKSGGEVGYIEGLKVWHKDGTDAQSKKFPEYFERKWKEEL